jgi:para-nitrobenzyl esterase
MVVGAVRLSRPWHDRSTDLQEDAMDPVVSVAQGQLRGNEKDGILSFKGIPYAAAPFGTNRFAAPVPAPSWVGIRDAVEYGPRVPKPPSDVTGDLRPPPTE